MMLLLFLLLNSYFLQAQRGFHITLAAIPQNTWILNVGDFDNGRTQFEPQITFGFGGLLQGGFNFSDPFGFRIGCLLSTQGQKHTALDSSQKRLTSQRKLQYVKLPLMLHFNSEKGPVLFSFEGGAQFGFLLDATHLDAGNLLNYPFETADLYEVQELSFAWVLGVEIEVTDHIHLVLEHRGDYSFYDIENKEFVFDGQDFYNSIRPKAENFTAGLMLGATYYWLPKGLWRRGRLWRR